VLPPRRRLFFGGGGGLIGYQAGVVHGMFTLFGTEWTNAQPQGRGNLGPLYMEGISAGAAIAGYATATCRFSGDDWQKRDMCYWYYTAIRKIYEQRRRNGFIGKFNLKMHRTVYQLAREFFIECHKVSSRSGRKCNTDDGSTSVSWLRQFAAYATSVPRLELLIFDRINTADEFAQCIESSSYVPVVVGKICSAGPRKAMHKMVQSASSSLLSKIVSLGSFGSLQSPLQKQKRASAARVQPCHPFVYHLDGAVACWFNDVRLAKADRTVSFIVLHAFGTFGKETAENAGGMNGAIGAHQVVQLSSWRSISLRDILISGDLERADKAFWQGFDDFISRGEDMKRILEETLQVNLSPSSTRVENERERKNLLLSTEMCGSNIDFRTRPDLFACQK